MHKRILDVDPFTKTITYHHYDELTDETIIETVQDVSPFLERNKRLRNDEDYKKRGIKNEWWHVGSIPQVIQEKWLREYGIDCFNKDHWPRVRRLLNDPEYRYLTTTTGRI